MANRMRLWICLCLVNLCIVAFFGFGLRSKILFSLPFIDYRSLLSAHSHFAFGGWAGLSLITLLIYWLLPHHLHRKKIYQWLLGGIEVSALGMAVFFPFQGYGFASIFCSSLYIVVTYVFGWIFIRDVLISVKNKVTRLLSVSAVLSLLVSAIGPLGLVYILVSHSGNSILYRDSIYTFLHFQYNGFFTLSVMAVLSARLEQKGWIPGKDAHRFAVLLVSSILPALFLSLLWHNNVLFYILAALGCIFILASLYYFFRFYSRTARHKLFGTGLGRSLGELAFFSFALKMILNVGTIFPQLGNAVYGDRPVIIGFLHLVFLAFITLFILGSLIAEGFFDRNGRTVRAPILVFATGILANEILLMLQGLGILFQTNSYIYNWLLWFAAILLFTGALLMAVTAVRLRPSRNIRN